MDKACKNCKIVIKKGDVCPLCGKSDLTTNWKGFTYVFDAERSEIAGKLGVNTPGKYALRMSK
ncbi:MAG: DNA-directed RNA polymerase subunit E'' [Candidatus Diapherotrites archaeon]|nr:DNA-directed RNA polymerase subunit E'' [Candidatus Diapherotrites archaeon]